MFKALKPLFLVFNVIKNHLPMSQIAPQQRQFLAGLQNRDFGVKNFAQGPNQHIAVINFIPNKISHFFSYGNK